MKESWKVLEKGFKRSGAEKNQVTLRCLILVFLLGMGDVRAAALRPA